MRSVRIGRRILIRQEWMDQWLEKGGVEVAH